MDNLNTLEQLEEYFRKVNCYGRENCCFTCSSMQSSQFGIIGALISIKKNRKIMGYLLNKNENGICLIPVVMDTLTKNKIDIDNYVLLKNEDIAKVIIKNEEIGFKKIKIVLKDNTKYVMKTPKKIIKADYHQMNLNKFIELYSNKSN